MSKLYIIQSYCTSEDDIFSVDPNFIENIVTDNKEEAEKICDFITDYNENTTGKDDLINSYAIIKEIDLGNTTIDSNIKFDTLKSVKETHTLYN